MAGLHDLLTHTLIVAVCPTGTSLIHPLVVLATRPPSGM